MGEEIRKKNCRRDVGHRSPNDPDNEQPGKKFRTGFGILKRLTKNVNRYLAQVGQGSWHPENDALPPARRRALSGRAWRWSAMCGCLSTRPQMNRLRTRSGFKCL